MQLQDLREGLGFTKGIQRDWPGSAEKLEQAIRTRIAPGYDLFKGRTFLTEGELQAFLDDQRNAAETIDLIGRVETVKLLVAAFRKITEVLFKRWSETPDPHWEELTEWLKVVRSLVIIECYAEWPGRRLAERESESGTPEFEGLPPLWFEHLPLRDADSLKGEIAICSNRARKWELKHRREVAADVVSPEPAEAVSAPMEVSAAPAVTPEATAQAPSTDATSLPAPVEPSTAVEPAAVADAAQAPAPCFAEPGESAMDSAAPPTASLPAPSPAPSAPPIPGAETAAPLPAPPPTPSTALAEDPESPEEPAAPTGQKKRPGPGRLPLPGSDQILPAYDRLRHRLGRPPTKTEVAQEAYQEYADAEPKTRDLLYDRVDKALERADRPTSPARSL
jgi:hypothetical protein